MCFEVKQEGHSVFSTMQCYSETRGEFISLAAYGTLAGDLGREGECSQFHMQGRYKCRD